LIAPAVSDHDSFDAARVEFLCLLLGRVDESFCADSNEVGNVGFLPIEGLVRCLPFESRSWASILEMRNGTREFGPEFLWELRFGKDSSDTFANRPVDSFCDTVLFGSIWSRLFVMDSRLFAQLRHLLAIFSPAVRPDRFDAASILFEDVPEFEETFADFLCRFGL